MPNLTLILLAAGLGSRYGGLKQLEPVGPHGEFILHYSIYDALQAGFNRIVLVLRKSMFEIFQDRIGKTVNSMCSPEYVFQELDELPPGMQLPEDRQKPWGTAHAVWCCRHQVNGPFAVINADDFYGRSSYQVMRQLLRSFHPAENTYGLAGYPIENTLSEHGAVARAICDVDSSGQLIGIQERTRVLSHQGTCGYLDEQDTLHPVSTGSCVSMNFWAFTPSVFSELQNCFQSFYESPGFKPATSEFFLPDMIGKLMQNKKAVVKLEPIHERWFGITYPEDKNFVKEELRRYHLSGVYPHSLWELMIGSKFPQPG
jgi:NDP-sugar pyrophosphorylase family protein